MSSHLSQNKMAKCHRCWVVLYVKTNSLSCSLTINVVHFSKPANAASGAREIIYSIKARERE